MNTLIKEHKVEVFKVQDIAVYVFILALGILFHWFLKSEIIVTNSDDLKSLYRGFDSINGGINTFFEWTTLLANKQGRFYFLITDFFSHLPYLIEPEWLRSLVIASVYSLAGLCVSYFLYLFTGRVRPGQLFFILYLTCIPVYAAWYAYYHWPLYWFLPVLIFTLGLIAWNYAKRVARTPFSRAFLYSVYTLFCFSAILFSEMYFMFFGALIFLLLIKHIFAGRIIGSAELSDWRYIFSKWKFISVSFLPFILYLISYVYFLVTQANEFTRVSSKLSLNLEPSAVAGAVKAFFVAAFPINHLTLSQANRFVKMQFHEFAHGEAILPVIALAAMLLFVVCIGLAFAYLLRFGSSANLSRDVVTREGYPLWLKLLLPLTLGYIFISIHVMTGSYQNWLTDYKPWYTPAFHLSASFLIALVLLVEHTSARSYHFTTRAKWLVSLLIVVVSSGVIAINTLSTLAVRDALKNRNTVWHLMYQLKSSDVPRQIMKSEAILFEDLPDAKKLERSEIFSAFIDKEVKVYPDSSNTIKGYDWVIDIRYGSDYEDAFMLIGRPVSSVEGVNLFREIWVVPYTGLRVKNILIEKDAKCSLPLIRAKKTRRSIWVRAENIFSMDEVFLKLRKQKKKPECSLE